MLSNQFWNEFISAHSGCSSHSSYIQSLGARSCKEVVRWLHPKVRWMFCQQYY